MANRYRWDSTVPQAPFILASHPWPLTERSMATAPSRPLGPTLLGVPRHRPRQTWFARLMLCAAAVAALQAPVAADEFTVISPGKSIM